MNEDIERQVAGEHAEIDRYTLLLDRLRDDPTFLTLCGAQLAGTTRSRWETAHAAVVTAASRLDKWRETVAEADRLLRTDSPNPAGAGQILSGRTVRLTRAETPKEDRRPPASASASSEPRFGLGYVKSLIAGDIRTAQGVVDDVAKVLTAARPQLDQLMAGLDDAEALLDPMAQDADRAELTTLRRGFEEVRELVEADPLALRLAGAAGHWGQARLTSLDTIETGLTRLTGRLARPAVGQAETASRLARLRVAVGELAALESRARGRRASLAERITVADMPAAPFATADLDARLAAAEARLRPGWRAGHGELDEIDSAIWAATREAEQVIQWADEISAEWELLDFRLKNYRRRADRSGLVMRPELADAHQQARQLLRAAPCDLRQAADAVREYMTRVNDLGQAAP